MEITRILFVCIQCKILLTAIYVLINLKGRDEKICPRCHKKLRDDNTIKVSSELLLKITAHQRKEYSKVSKRNKLKYGIPFKTQKELKVFILDCIL